MRRRRLLSFAEERIYRSPENEPGFNARKLLYGDAWAEGVNGLPMFHDKKLISDAIMAPLLHEGTKKYLYLLRKEIRKNANELLNTGVYLLMLAGYYNNMTGFLYLWQLYGEHLSGHAFSIVVNSLQLVDRCRPLVLLLRISGSRRKEIAQCVDIWPGKKMRCKKVLKRAGLEFR